MTLAELPSVLLVIEDSDEDFDTVVEAVMRSGVSAEVTRATTAETGLMLLRELAGIRIVVVLMDLNTPGLDGREALAEIKSDVALASTPVVIFSTSANPKDVGHCYAAGANAYHVKPVRYPHHLQLVTDVVGYWICQVTLSSPEGFPS